MMAALVWALAFWALTLVGNRVATPPNTPAAAPHRAQRLRRPVAGVWAAGVTEVLKSWDRTLVMGVSPWAW